VDLLPCEMSRTSARVVSNSNTSRVADHKDFKWSLIKSRPKGQQILAGASVSVR
jgi:hypothetical protein